MQRPTGITILAVLAAIGGVFALIAAFPLMGFGAIGGGTFFLGLLTLILAVASLGLAYGFWFLKPWAWMAGIGVEAFSILMALINLISGQGFFSFLISVAIAGGIIYYLFTPAIKKVFGRA